MNPKWRYEWLKAMRSEDYKPGTGVMRSTDNLFDPLGILFDIHPLGNWGEPDEDSYSAVVGDDIERCFLPLAVAESVGLSSRDRNYNHQFVIADMADNGASHLDIAQWIEMNL